MAPNTVKINSGDVHCTRMAKLLDPLIKSGVVPNETIFTANFATKWGGDTDKILLMPGPIWYAKDIFGGTLQVPAGEMTAALPLRWNKRAARDRPSRRRPVGRLPAHGERGGRNRLREVRHDVRIKSKVNARRGYPSYGPPRTSS